MGNAILRAVWVVSFSFSMGCLAGNSSGGGTVHGFGSQFSGKHLNYVLTMQMSSYPTDPHSNWANLWATDAHSGYSAFLPDGGTIRELRKHEVFGSYPRFNGRFGKWTGVFANKSATSDRDASILLMVARNPSGASIITHKLTEQSIVEKVECVCAPHYKRYWVEIKLHHRQPNRTWVQNLVVGDYSDKRECEDNYARDFAAQCDLSP
jgi:hypothetical protein